MSEIFFLQLRQILGGKRKWLVALCLALPVGLVLLTMGGGLGRIKERLDNPPAAGDPPRPGMREVLWEGEDVWLAMEQVRLTAEGPYLYYRYSHRSDATPTPKPPRSGITYFFGGGVMIIDRNGRLWERPGEEVSSLGIARSRGGFTEELRNLERPWELVGGTFLFVLFPWAAVLLLAMLYGSSMLGNELDGRTLTYLMTRPIARWKIVLGKYLAILAALWPPLVLGLVLAWLALERPGGVTLLAAITAASTGGLIAYNALFAFIGFVIPRWSLIVALMYAVVFEVLLSFVPALVNTVTVTYYLRSMVRQWIDLDLPREMERVVGDASLVGAFGALALITGITLAGACWMLSRREYRITDEP